MNRTAWVRGGGLPGAGGGTFRLAWTYDAADHVTSVL